MVDYRENNPDFDFTKFKEDVENNNDSSEDIVLDKLEKVKIDVTKNIPKPEICLSIGEGENKQIIGILGDFTVISGKAKSRKSFCVNILTAAALTNSTINGIKGNLPNSKNQILYFDTEQSDYSIQLAIKRVCRLSNTPKPENLHVYAMRKFDYKEILEMIEAKIYATSNLGLVIIDGIRDLVSSINDEEQAIRISRALLKWSNELNIHIIVVIHQNKIDTSVRGHLGTEIQNKAMLVLSVEKAVLNNKISIVKPEYSRFKEPMSFAFSIDDNGLPVEAQLPEKIRRQTKSSDSKTEEEHKKILKSIFNEIDKPNGATIKKKLQIHFGIGENVSRKYLSRYQEEEWIELNGKSGAKNSHFTLKI